jgi:TRAP-type C4-dicarboxylate transport system permease small subunit
MSRLCKSLRIGAELVTIALIVVMFLSVVYQVVTRYVLGSPVNWTMEAALIAWVWVIFWAGALLVPDRDQIRMDIVYAACPPWLQRVFVALASIITVVALVLALAPSYDFVEFMRIDHSPLLRIRHDYVFAIFLLFIVMAILRTVVKFVYAVRNGPLEDL